MAEWCETVGPSEKVDKGTLRDVQWVTSKEMTGMQTPLTEDSAWKGSPWKRKSGKIGILGIVVVCILLSTIVALAVLLFQSRNENESMKAKGFDEVYLMPDAQSMNSKNTHKDKDEANINKPTKTSAISHSEGTPVTNKTSEKLASQKPALSTNVSSSNVTNPSENITIIEVDIVEVDFYDDDDGDDDYQYESDEGAYYHIGDDFPDSLDATGASTSNVSELQIVPKSEWGGLPPMAAQEQPLPVPYIVISQTDGLRCFSIDSCSERMRNLQQYHMIEQSLPDIGVNFYVGGDGLVYVGRGWNVTNFHIGYVRHKNIGISFIGDFNLYPPSEDQVTAAKELIALGVLLNVLDPNYKIIAHREIQEPESLVLGPGPYLLNEIETWPNRCFKSCSDENKSTTETDLTDDTGYSFLRYLGLS